MTSNLNTLQKKQILKNRLTFFITILFTYVLLFEFILPINKILPKPSLLIESIPALFEEYNLLAEMTISTTIIYLSIPIAFLILYLISFSLDRIMKMNPGFFNNFRLFRNFPAFFFAILFAFWFGDSLFAELGFALFASTFFFIITYIGTLHKVENQYLDSASSLLIEGKELHKKVIWKYCQPIIYDELKRLHYYLWVLVLIYEFIGGENGFGGVYNLALEYNDFSAIIMLGIIVALLIWLGNSIIDYVRNKTVFWKV
ncbi:MAG: ABC transporter permease subunit [Melioribacteraceae bacterium]|nr:ABC transporter permease subunit [Melioribacteraceae bacterium]